ncbi:Uncharacterised protein [Mycobacteroides abscessus subsp. abscessus]|nr:Uncharacterised protein [Mycobacteroides abscessus subsp. abscessus]
MFQRRYFGTCHAGRRHHDGRHTDRPGGQHGHGPGLRGTSGVVVAIHPGSRQGQEQTAGTHLT